MADNNHCHTMNRLLDSAERLFAENGYRGTSLRMITSDAGVNLAAVNYHFGSKEELVRQVFLRKMEPLNQARIAKIEQVLSDSWEEGQRPTIKDVLNAFIGPTFEMILDSSTGKSFITLIVRSMADTDSTLNKCFAESVGHVFQIFHQAMCRAMPDTDPQVVMFKLVMGMTTMGGMLKRMSSDDVFQAWMDEKGMDNMRRWAITEENLIKYINAGMEAE